MPIYACEKCKKKFKQKCHYDNHLNRKYPCVINDNSDNEDNDISESNKKLKSKDPGHKCNNCKKTFSQKSSLLRHIELYCFKESETDIINQEFVTEKNEGINTIKLIFSTINLNGIKDNKNVLWFKAKNCATILGYTNSTKSINDHVSDKYIIRYKKLIDTIGGNEMETLTYNEKNTKWINESGLYELTMKSKMPLAKKFQEWLHEEVLPSIRKTGKYDMTTNCFFDDHHISDYKKSNVNYIGYVGTYKGEDYFKYGYTDDFVTREAAHLKDYDHFIVKYVGKCIDNKGIESEFERHLDRYKIRKTEIINSKKHKELFITTDKHNLETLINKMNYLIEKHNKRYLKNNVSDDEQLLKIRKNNDNFDYKSILLVEQEKTKAEKLKKESKMLDIKQKILDTKQKIFDLLANGKITKSEATKFIAEL